jgi:hypothetical protein
MLLAPSLYAFRFPRWTGQPDSFATMRIGGTVTDKITLLLVRKDATKIKVLDTIPGNIGDGASEDEPLGRLVIGRSTPLKRDRKYLSYDEC